MFLLNCNRYVVFCRTWECCIYIHWTIWDKNAIRNMMFSFLWNAVLFLSLGRQCAQADPSIILTLRNIFFFKFWRFKMWIRSSLVVRGSDWDLASLVVSFPPPPTAPSNRSEEGYAWRPINFLLFHHLTLFHTTISHACHFWPIANKINMLTMPKSQQSWVLSKEIREVTYKAVLNKDVLATPLFMLIENHDRKKPAPTTWQVR